MTAAWTQAGKPCWEPACPSGLLWLFVYAPGTVLICCGKLVIYLFTPILLPTPCFCFPFVGIKGVHHHTLHYFLYWLFISVFQDTVSLCLTVPADCWNSHTGHELRDLPASAFQVPEFKVVHHHAWHKGMKWGFVGWLLAWVF